MASIATFKFIDLDGSVIKEGHTLGGSSMTRYNVVFNNNTIEFWTSDTIQPQNIIRFSGEGITGYQWYDGTYHPVGTSYEFYDIGLSITVSAVKYITDLTDTTWYVKAGWQCAQNYGIFNIESNLSPNTIAIGYQATDDGKNALSVTAQNSRIACFYSSDGSPILGTEANYSNDMDITLNITGGTDVKNPYLISWLETNGTQLKVTNLTNTTWYIPEGWEAKAGYGQFDIGGTLNSAAGQVPPYDNLDQFSIGYYYANASDFKDNYKTEIVDSIILSSLPSIMRSDHDFNVTITGGTDVTNPKLIAWLSKYGTLLKVTDLTNTSWSVPVGWEAEAGYGQYAVDFIIADSYGITSYSSFYIGYKLDRGLGAVVSTSNYIYVGSGYSFDNSVAINITFNGGTDIKNPKLIAWLSKYGGLQERITDLTGYTVTVPSGWSASAGYGRYDVEGTVYSSSESNQSSYLVVNGFNIGYTWVGDGEGFWITSDSNIICYDTVLNFQIYSYESFEFTITGGDDVDDPYLIQWFYDNNATFTKIEEPEQSEEPTTIIYNNTTSQLSINQTATFPCSGLVMKDDVSIVFATNGMIKYNDVVTPIDEWHTAILSCKDKIMKSNLEVIIKQLDAATIEIDGDMLKIYDISNLGKFATLYIDDVAIEDIDLSPLVMINPLEGSIIEYLLLGKHTVYQYEFEGIVPTSVTLNGETSDVSVTKVICTNDDGYTSKVIAYVSGKIEVENEQWYTNYTMGTLDCEISFANTSGTTVRDTFAVKGQICDICFAAGTLISTPSGFIPIEEIQEGDIIHSYNFLTNSIEEDEVLYFSLQNGSTDIHYITFDNGNRIGATSTHAFMAEEGWKCITPNEHTITDQQLVIGDKVQTSDGGYTTVTNIEPDGTPQPIYHISLANNVCLLVAGDEDCMPVLAEHLTSISTYHYA